MRSGTFLGLVGGAFLLATSAQAAGCATDGTTPDELQARADLESLSRSASDYVDVPDANDPRAPTFFKQAATLTELQSRLDVARSVVHDLDQIASNPGGLRGMTIDPAAAARELAHAKGDVDKIQAKIDGVLADADANGLPLRAPDGTAVSGKRAMEAHFWRQVEGSATARIHEANVAGAVTSDGHTLIRTVRAVETGDTHEMLEHGQTRSLLSPAEIQKIARGQ